METPQPQVWTTAPVTIKVNGQTVATIEPNGDTLGSLARQYAQSHGLRAFTVLVDGQPADTSRAAQPLAGVSIIELVSKDARGSTA